MSAAVLPLYGRNASRVLGTVLGREEHLRRMSEAFASAPLVTLRGAPGAGTTTLARYFASEHPEKRFVWVSVASDATRERLLADLARAMNLELRAANTVVALARVADALEVSRAMLVLDAVDESLGTVRSLVADLAECTQCAAILVCGQRVLGLPFERVVEVAPLALSDAAALLRMRVAQRSVTAAAILRDEDARVLAERASRLPLAIELLAARVCSLGVAAAIAESSLLGLASIDAALARLTRETPALARSLAALSVFDGSFDREAACFVLDDENADDALDALVGASFVQVEHRAMGALFTVPSVFRSYALRIHDGSAARAKHAEYFASVEGCFNDRTQRWSAVSQLRSELLAAWRYALSVNDGALALALATRLEPLLLTQGPVELHRHLLTTTIDRFAHDHGAVFELELSLARIDAIRGHYGAAVARGTEALERALRLHDERSVGWASVVLCYSLAALGKFSAAVEHGKRAEQAANSVRCHALAAQAEQTLALVAFRSGHLQEARDGFRRALALAVQAGAGRVVGIVHANLARIAEQLGRYDEALARIAEAEQAWLAVDDRVHLVRLMVQRESVRVAQGERGGAAVLQRALSIAEGQGNLVTALEAREVLVRSALLEEEHERALDAVNALEASARFCDDHAWKDRVSALRKQVEQGGVSTARVLCLSRDATKLTWEGTSLDFSRRGALRRVLLALALAHERGATLSTAEVREAGWPGEKMAAESAAARVYMAIRRLREAGFERLIVTLEEGYGFDRGVVLQWK